MVVVVIVVVVLVVVVVVVRPYNPDARQRNLDLLCLIRILLTVAPW